MDELKVIPNLIFECQLQVVIVAQYAEAIIAIQDYVCAYVYAC